VFLVKTFFFLKIKIQEKEKKKNPGNALAAW